MPRPVTRPRVTVVIPTHNRAQWLPESIKGVLGQSFDDFVLVVSDNASTDGTGEVVHGFSDPRIVYRRHPNDIGILANHNYCLANITTDYALIVPDDDVIYPDLLAETVPVLDNHERVGMVHTAFNVVEASGAVSVSDMNWTGGLSSDTVESGMDFITESMSWSCRVCASTALVRTRALPSGYMEARDFPAVDFGLWLRMALDWDMAFVAKTLAAYRIHHASHSAAFGPVIGWGYGQDFEIVSALKGVKLRFLREHAERLGDVARLRRLAEKAMRRELVLMVRNRTLPRRQLSTTVRLLAASAATDPGVAREPDAWRLLGASLLGPRLVERLARRRSDGP